MTYDSYADLIGLPYIEGEQDCYGLIRKYYEKNFDLPLRNYARPGDFAYSNIDLITENFLREGFQVVDVSLDRLNIGDCLLMRIGGAPLINHVAIYVGNHYILHHLYNRVSSEDAFTKFWKKQVAMVVRHPDVQPVKHLNRVDFIDLIPEHVRVRNSS